MKGKGILFLFMFIALTVLLVGSAARSEDVATLNAMIKTMGGNWVAGETSMSRLSPDQQTRRLGLLRHTSSPGGKVLAAPQGLTAVPTSLDWRNNGGNYVTRVKDQGNCGSCWAFSAAGTAESAILIARGTPNVDLDLSEQVMLSCSGAGSCLGGYINTASNYLRDTGLPLESCYGYTGMDGVCAYACANWQATAYKIQDWSWVVPYSTTPTTDVIKNALYAYGPLSTTMHVYSDFYNYVSGVYKHTSGSYVGDHAIIIIGYNDASQYFIVKNSWGTGWGEQGYFRIAYSELTSATGFGYETIAHQGAAQNTYTLAVSKSGMGTGTISSYPNGINCGATCSAAYAKNTSVTLTPTPDYGSTFTGWSGACSGTGTCTVMMDSAKFVTATFNPGGYTLSVSKTGTGTGTVTSNPAGVSCGATCSASFTSGTQVTLTATPNNGSTFAGWSGVCSGTGTCFVTMDTVKSVTATFNVPPGPQINSIVDGITYSTTIAPTSVMTIFGSNLSAGGNMVHLQRSGYGDVWLYNGDGHYFWDGNGTQINASLDGRVAAGTWTVTVRNASGGSSSPYTLTIQNNAASNNAAWCYSSSYSYYGYQNWLCNAAYNPTYCYTSSWQWTSCPH